ncbi:hypothetical protein BO78DRAFT_436492 [Aspergillus sclerotiicarbonarius CBS 121057]|uniref:F-box domain-containing protein n=1 Tax=Aspergillus sclerotiicarbonarius (strain CBS 121057 / IBT 28362) TaxID=1448318 RepID=A0A319DTU1_ASPSB|nr:hypothetical protein BO78DRAFT_436492 [Aspergillus sclerotiicarbonarius CBS 121057]
MFSAMLMDPSANYSPFCMPTRPHVRIPDANEPGIWETSDTPSHKKTDLYLFHAICWDRLQGHFNPGEVPLVCLYEALECLPFPVGGRLWSARELPRRPGCLPWCHPQDQDRIVRNGRFGLPSLSELMRFAKNSPTPLATTTTRLLRSPQTDPLHRLPLEIIESIGSLLSTQDALHLRQASRAATPLFSSPTFWRSRFAINSERGFLLPVIQQYTNPQHRQDIDWRLLYHCTRHLNSSGWFQFEIHIWESLRWLRDTAVATHQCQNPPLAFRGNALHHYHNTTYHGTHLESVPITPSLHKITISALQDTRKVYITGMEFIFADQPSIMLGYSTPGAKPATKDMYENGYESRDDWLYPGIFLTLDVARLRGIAAYRGLNCVRGVSIIEGAGEVEDEGEERDRRQPYSVGYNVRLTVQQAVCFLALGEVKWVIAVFDSRRMIDIGVLGVAKKRMKERPCGEWERIIDVFRRDGSVPANLEFR